MTSFDQIAHWDGEYAAGCWDRLCESRQVAHYALLYGLACHYKKLNVVLELGCGEGLLADYMPKDNLYHGLDLSPVAIAIANERRGAPNRIFWAGDAVEWTPPRKYSCVFLNEFLYYLGDKAQHCVDRATQFLEPGGIIVTSQYGKAFEAPTLHLLEQFESYHKNGWWHTAAFAPETK